jgi:hypothetical protein
MMASRGMGAINPSKMPGKKEITRKDDPNKVAMYKRGGKVKRYNGNEESAVEEETIKELTPAQMAARHAASLNRSKQSSSSQDDGLSIKPTHAMLEKGYKRIGANISKDIPLDDKSRLNFNTDVAAVRAQGQGTRAALDRSTAEYTRSLDKDTTFGASMSKSPQEKRFMVALNKSFQNGGEVWDTPNPTKKHKKLSPAKKAKAKAAAKAAGRKYPNLIDNMRAAK